MTTDTPGTAYISAGRAADSTPGIPAGSTAGPGPGTRGRHRRPRPRRPLLAAACLALAAGALSLVRLTADPGIGGTDVAEAAPGRDTVATTGGTARSGAPDDPGTRPPAPSTGREDGRGRSGNGGYGTSARPRQDRGERSADAATTEPGSGARPGTKVSSTPPARGATAAPAPPHRTETGEPPRETPAPPAPSPPATDRPGLCVPLIGVCVDLGDRP